MWKNNNNPLVVQASYYICVYTRRQSCLFVEHLEGFIVFVILFAGVVKKVKKGP